MEKEEAESLTLREAWNKRVKQSRNKTFIISEGASYSYSEIDKCADEKLAFLKKLNVKKGDIVCLQFELDFENAVYITACIKLGAIINPLNPHFDIDEITNLVDRFKPYLILAQHAVRGRDTLYDIDKLKNYSSNQIGDLKYFKRDNHEIHYCINNDCEDPILILNTSGTTGAPKGVVLTNRNVISSEIAYNQAFQMKENDMLLMPSGFYHAIGFHHGLVSTVLNGSTLVIMRHYKATTLSELISRYPITIINSVPTVMYDVLFLTENLNKLRQLICGGDKISDKLLKQAVKRKIPLYSCYGLTEAVPFSFTTPSYYRYMGGMTTAVQAMPGYIIRLVDSNGVVISAANVHGTIEVKGPSVFKEYLFNPKKTYSSFDGEWFNTGDEGHYNDHGFLEIDGRNSDKIIRGGENISAHVVEEKIKHCNNVANVAVIGIPDDRLGQRIGAFIVLKNKNNILTKENIISSLKGHLVDKKFWPEYVWVLDKIPLTANGKVKKYALLQQVRDEQYHVK